MSTDCYCPEHQNCFECETIYHGEPHYSVPVTMFDALLSVLHQNPTAWAIPMAKAELRKASNF